GYEVTNEIYYELKQKGLKSEDGIYDLIIIGAGAAGLSCALEAKKHKLSYVALEGTRVANTIVNFPRGKIIFAEPKQIVYKSRLPIVEATREETLQEWYKMLKAEELNIREGSPVKDVKKRGEYLFDVTLEDGTVMKGKRVI